LLPDTLNIAMNVNKRPTPLYSAIAKKGTPCPVCGFASYSRNGIHPQCARRREDEKRLARLRSPQKQDSQRASTPPPNALKPCHKRCPQCATQVHARRSHCECGHKFATSKAQSLQ
jgi:hypothetical protein